MSYTEPADSLSEKARDTAMVLKSLREEIEAVDYYNQRADVTKDEQVRALLLHNRNEEIEHAVMCLEWLRREIPEFDVNMRKFFFTSSPLTQVEGSVADAAPSGTGSLNIGKL